MFWELMFSLPTTRLTSVVTWCINTILILLAADFVFTPVFDSATDVTFTRVGAVYSDAAKVVVRYPLFEAGATEHYVRVQWRPIADTADDRWNDGPVLHLGPEFDWTNATKLTKLWPSTEYECTLLALSLTANTLTSTPDILADVERRILPYPNSPIRFHTFPDSRLLTGSHFRFVVSSCVKPNFPYQPFQNRRIKGFDLLADYLFPESTVVDTPETILDLVATVNSTESLNPLEIDVDIHANASVPAVQDVIPAALASEHSVPTEFMLFLVNRGFALHDEGCLTCYRATSSTPTSQITRVIQQTRTVVCTGTITTALASARSTNDCVRSRILAYLAFYLTLALSHLPHL